MPAERVQLARRRGRGATGRSEAAGSLGAGARRARQGESIAGLQRARLLSAAVGLLADEGHERFSASAMCVRAGVSRRTFYELFENRQACLAAVLTDTEARFERLIASLAPDGLSWCERVRAGLWAILCLAESDPALAKVCLVESQRAGGIVLDERQRIINRLIAAVDEGSCQDARVQVASGLTAEAVTGAVSSVIAARLAASHNDGDLGLPGLLGELMGMIVLPYLGPVAAKREIKRKLPATLLASSSGESGVAGGGVDPLASLAMRLTYRTVRVLLALADHPGASNRLIGDEAGITDQGQISKLLSRLQRIGLIENTEMHPGKGVPNSWAITPNGHRVIATIRAHTQGRRPGSHER